LLAGSGLLRVAGSSLSHPAALLPRALKPVRIIVNREPTYLDVRGCGAAGRHVLPLADGARD
jgi:hypothetical protein